MRSHARARSARLATAASACALALVSTGYVSTSIASAVSRKGLADVFDPLDYRGLADAPGAPDSGQGCLRTRRKGPAHQPSTDAEPKHRGEGTAPRLPKCVARNVRSGQPRHRAGGDSLQTGRRPRYIDRSQKARPLQRHDVDRRSRRLKSSSQGRCPRCLIR